MASLQIPKVPSTPFPERSVYNEAGAVSMVIGTGPTVMVQLLVTNLTSTDGYVHLFNTTVVPANGTAPLLSIPLPGSGAISFDSPVGASTGLVAAISTTAGTLTASSNNAKFFANLQES